MALEACKFEMWYPATLQPQAPPCQGLKEINQFLSEMVIDNIVPYRRHAAPPLCSRSAVVPCSAAVILHANAQPQQMGTRVFPILWTAGVRDELYGPNVTEVRYVFVQPCSSIIATAKSHEVPGVELYGPSGKHTPIALRTASACGGRRAAARHMPPAMRVHGDHV